MMSHLYNRIPVSSKTACRKWRLSQLLHAILGVFRNSYGIDCQSRRLQNYPSRIGDLQVPEPLNFKMRPITNPFRATSLYLHEDISREFKKRRRRRHGQCRLKMNLYFTYESYESRDTLMPFSLFLTSKTLSNWIWNPALN